MLKFPTSSTCGEKKIENTSLQSLFFLWYTKSMLTISKKSKYDLKIASKIMGVKEDALFERAITFYLHAIKDKISLKKEFDNWDVLSDEAFLRMNF